MQWDRETYVKWQVLISLVISFSTHSWTSCHVPSTVLSSKATELSKPHDKCQEFTVQWLPWNFWKCNKWLSFLSSRGQCQREAFSGQYCRINTHSFAKTTNQLWKRPFRPVCFRWPYPWAVPFPGRTRSPFKLKEVFILENHFIMPLVQKNLQNVFNQ